MKYHCMVSAFAKAMNLMPEELVGMMLHDGLGTFPDTNIQRTHHLQEIIDVGSKIGVWFCPIELIPQSIDPETQTTFQIGFGNGTVSANFSRFIDYLAVSKGVIIGMRGRSGHAVYNNMGKCFDDEDTWWKLWGVETSFVPAVYWRAVWKNT